MELHKDINDRTLLTIGCENCGSNMEKQTRVFGKSVAGDVYSMTLGIRVCLLFQKVSLQNRSYLFKKKLSWLNQEKTVFCNYFFSI